MSAFCSTSAVATPAFGRCDLDEMTAEGRSSARIARPPLYSLASTMRDGIARRALRRSVPARLRSEIYRLRMRGVRGYARSKLAARGGGAASRPRANAPFDIGAAVPIVLHASTVHGIESHLRETAKGAGSELDVFIELAHGHETFVDVGAGAGVFSAAFCAATGERAFAFEPSPEMFDRLTSLSELNPSFEIMRLNVALGDEPGTRAVESHGPQYRGVSAAADGGDAMTVETLDEFAERNTLSPDFAKIDVEGMEREALRGGILTFSEHVDTLMLEVHPRILGSTDAVAEVEGLLREIGFDLFTLERVPIMDLARHAERRGGQLARAVNIVCTKSSRSAAM
jgi:FkbM family methyltransferase